MSEETKTELKLPAAYVRPSLAEFTGPGHGYPADQYESFFARVEEDLAEKYASGEITDETFVDIRDPKYVDEEMTDADHDGLPDILHIKSQVRGRANRTLRARQPTRHRFKQYLFADPSKRLVRGRVLRVKASDVRTNLEELLDKEASGILSVHAPNGQRVDLQALKAGRVSLAPLAATPALPNPPLDSAANDIPAGENMQQYLGGTFVNDPAADEVVENMLAEKAIEVGKKERDPKAEETGAEVDPANPAPPAPALPAAEPAVSTELEQPPMGVDGNTAPIVDQLPKDSESSVKAPATPVVAEEQDQSAIDPAADTELQEPLAINAGDDEAPVTDEVPDPVDEAPKASSSKKSGKKGGHK